MITDIELTNFKCFSFQGLRTRELTVIAGSNAAGKSSVVQALLLLRQTYLARKDITTAALNGGLVNLINADNILNLDAKQPTINITVTDDSIDNEDFWIEIKADKADRQPSCIVSDNFEEACRRSPLFRSDFVYLNAARITPQEEYIMRQNSDTDSRLGDKTGHRTVFRLIDALDNSETLKLPGLDLSGDRTVASNVNKWLSYIMGSEVSVSADGNPTDGRANLQFATGRAVVGALNMAFGNTYVLPIIVGVLTASPGSMMIVENPEAHLHPKAQLRIGEFLAKAAEAGVQIFIETHSDHLLNGVRVAAKKEALDAGRVAIHFIEGEESGHNVAEIELHQDGSLSDWPEGFFDEWEKALHDIVAL